MINLNVNDRPDDDPPRPKSDLSDTVLESDGTLSSDTQSKTVEDAVVEIQAQPEPVDLGGTVEMLAIDRTIAVLPGEIPPLAPAPAADADRESDFDLRLDNTPTRVIGETTFVPTEEGQPSILNDTSVTQTISANQLCKQDAAFWGSLSPHDGASEPSQLQPAIDRSITETKLNLRTQVVTAPHAEDRRNSDYRLVRLLGKGGMGNVYVARQGSLDRLVALKVIKPMDEGRRRRFQERGTLAQVEQERRLQFISEAVVTGDLDHPNIVPIHDVAVTSDNTLFYAMKRVTGTPWAKVIRELSRDENLDILLKVCDAIGFAHTRGVVHRDIKPENIMLGEFGIVLVMDWGLALANPQFEKLDSIFQNGGLGGSPAYMAPEMALGPIDRIGPASDIYLLGATLFEIVTGTPPHDAPNVSECLRAVASNVIRAVPPAQRGELLDIALRAMASQPEDRFDDVPSFQAAIREYRAHSESIALAARASETLQEGIDSGRYDDFARAEFGFEESLSLWNGNSKAREGLNLARMQHAEVAYRRGEFGLGLSKLDPENPDHQALMERLRAGQMRLRSRQKLTKILQVSVALLAAVILIGGPIAMLAINREKNVAVAAREQAVASEEAAKRSAEQAKRSAQDEAEQRILADKNAQEASLARDKADYESYVSRIGLAKARIEQNEFDDARRILAELSEQSGPDRLGWEWRWLWNQTNQSAVLIESGAPAGDLTVPRTGPQRVATVIDDGSIVWVELALGGSVKNRHRIELPDGRHATAVAFAGERLEGPDQPSLIVGTREGELLRWDFATASIVQSTAGHSDRINAIRTTADGWILTASDDRTLRLWDSRLVDPLAVCWHLGPVKDLAAQWRDGRLLVIAAEAERGSGRVATWKLDRGEPLWSAQRLGDFQQHRRPVLSVALDSHGTLAASGDVGGQCFTWNPDDLRPTDHQKVVEEAIEAIAGGAEGNAVQGDRPNSARRTDRDELSDALSADRETTIRRLSDRVNDESGLTLAAEGTPSPAEVSAHRDAVRAIRFSPDDSMLLTASDDYTLKLWRTGNGTLSETLRGHGGAVRDANFIGNDAREVVSSSDDQTVRRWDLATSAVEPTVEGESFARDEAPQRVRKAHDDEILSARWDPTGHSIVTVSRDHTATILRANPRTASFEEVGALVDPNDVSRLFEGTSFVALSLAVDHRRGRLFIGSADSAVRIWDLARGTELAKLEETGLNTSLSVSPDGRWLVTGSSTASASAILWRLDPENPIRVEKQHTIDGHAEAVTAIAISPDSQTLATADKDGRLILWNLATGRALGAPIETLRGYRINSLAFLPHGRSLLIASDDQQLSRLDLASRQIVSRMNHDGAVTQVSVSDDGSRAVTLAEGTNERELTWTVTLWDLENSVATVLDRSVVARGGAMRNTASAARITTASLSGEGDQVLVGTWYGGERPATLAIWQARVGAVPKRVQSVELPRRLGRIEAALALPNQKVLTLNGDAGFLWDLKTLTHTLSFRDSGAITQVSFASDGRFVATASQSLKIWDVATRKAVAKLESPHSVAMRSAIFSPLPGSHRFATGGEDGSIRLWDFDPETFRIEMVSELSDPSQTSPIRRLAISADQQWLLACGDTGMIRLWRVDQSIPPVIYDVPGPDAMTSAAFSSDGQQLLVGGDDAIARLWELVERTADVAPPTVFRGHADRIEDVAFLQSGREPMRVLTASRDKSFRVWDPSPITGSSLEGDRVDHAMGREILTLRGHTQGLTAVDASSSGNLIMTAGRDGKVILWPASEPSKTYTP